MNKQQAHDLLEARKRGLAVLPSAIDHALFLTGDLGTNALVFSEGVDQSLPEESQRDWQSKGHDVVAGTGRYYGSEEWFRANHGPQKANE
jgi:hypothetical protein